MFARLVSLLVVLLLALPARSADIEVTETVPLSLSHSIGWVLKHAKPASDALGAWNVTDERWEEAVKATGEAEKENVTFDLWIPDGIGVAKGIVVVSGHGSGTEMFKDPTLREIARELHLALFKFVGNPVQRGFWPKHLLTERLKAYGAQVGHPELEFAPLFLYGHSNATGFSASFAAREPERVWGWISMRPGNANQILQPGGAEVPGMIMFGEDDPYFAKDNDQEIQQRRISLVEQMRKDHAARWHCVVEPKTGHLPTENTWPLVYAFLKHSFAARIPPDADPRQGPVKLKSVPLEDGCAGANWDPKLGGYQDLSVTPYENLPRDGQSASWLIDEEYARAWKAFQATGKAE